MNTIKRQTNPRHNHNKRILLVFGTRPDAIKMCPVVLRLRRSKFFETRVCVSGQHREMLDEVLEFFGVRPEYDLGIMTPGQDLFEITARVLSGMKGVLSDFKPHCMLVHGDTTTALAASISAYYMKIRIGHVEAGLRTGNKYAPFPEEANRRLAGALSDFHFVPTGTARANLLKEGVDDNSITITGNTAIDALYMALEKLKGGCLKPGFNIPGKKRLLLVTAHRRENFGKGLENICTALKEIAIKNRDVLIIYPVHPNPNVQKPAQKYLAGVKNITLTSPLNYRDFVYLMDKSYIILTDSGGIQEEAPSLGKPVLVLRDVTERPEAVEAGTVRLVGTDKESIVKQAQLLLDLRKEYHGMARKVNPYGDGNAAKRICRFLEERL